MNSRKLHRKLRFLVGFSLVYAGSMMLANWLFRGDAFQVTPIWPPAGVGLACLAVWGLRAWPAVALGVVVGEIGSGWLRGQWDSPLFVMFSVAGNTLGAMAGAWTLRRREHWLKEKDRVEAGVRLLSAAMVLALVSALIGSQALILFSNEPVESVASIIVPWFLGDMFGCIVMGPALLSLVYLVRNPERYIHDVVGRRLEKYLWGCAVFMAGAAWYWVSIHSPQFALAATFIPLTLLGWSALRFSVLFNHISVMVVVTAQFLFFGLRSSAAFAPDNAVEHAIMVLFFSTMALMPLFVSAAAHDTRRYRERLEVQANRDSLTGLYNRNAFEHRARKWFSSAGEGPVFLVYLDLDQLQIINDTAGHSAGDQLIVQVAGILSSNHTHDVMLARFGGDEYGILLRGLDQAGADQYVQDLLDQIAQLPLQYQDHLFSVTASAGVSGTLAGSFERAMSAADTACYEAKRQGGNRFVMAHLDKASQSASDFEWVARLREGLESDRLMLFAQPIVPCDKPSDGLRFEVLLRFIGEDGAPISPAQFIPLAERFNLISRIDRWVVSTALNALDKHRRPEQIDSCSINLSGASVGDEEFCEFLLERVALSSFSRQKICFEITETAAISNLASAVRLIRGLRRLGCRIALDDFGSGLSSFSYLKTLEVDEIKIDGSFVKDICTNPVDKTMVQSMNDIAHHLGKRTTAEWVEDEQTAELLREMRVNYLQGYHFARPEPLVKYLQTKIWGDSKRQSAVA